MFQLTPVRSLALGILLALTGLEFHCVETFYLTPAISSAIGEQTGDAKTKTKLAFKRTWEAFSGTEFNVSPYPVTPPGWLGWPFLCAGLVLICHGVDRQ